MELATLPIHERFHSFQGEGVHMGRSAFFIRTYGCPVQCDWCDAAGTWHPDWKPTEGVQRMAAHELAVEAEHSRAGFVVLTGGEPLIHKEGVAELSAELKRRYIPLHIETCGAFLMFCEAQWLTVSPKENKLPLPHMIARADEFKIIVDSPDAIKRWLSVVYTNKRATIWLQPEWSQRDNPEILKAIVDAVKSPGRSVQAGWQLHKLYAADQKDQRSAAPAPLGGDLSKGF